MRSPLLKLIATMPLILVIGSCGMSLPATSEPPRLPPGVPGVEAGDQRVVVQVEDAVWRGVNQHRAGMGLPELQPHPRITALAREHSAAMAAGSRDFGHDGFERRSAELEAALPLARMAENVAYNNLPPGSSGDTVVRGWLNSPGHRTNLEAPGATLTGVGAVRGSDGTIYVTQIYITVR